jgi:DNA invertase Pin-like site-specific DNA recombinase
MAQVIAYTRVSTGEQRDSGLGLSAQRSRLEQEASYRGWSEVEYITDDGYSAKSLKRPGIQRALGMLAAGDAGVLVVTKLDRLSRSVIDFAGLLSLAQRQGWALVVLDLGLDLTTPNGKFVASIMASVGELERDLIGERTKAALAVKRAQGTRLGRPVKLTLEIRQFICQARGNGYTLQSIANTLTAKGIPTAHGGSWRPGTVAHVLKSVALDA